MTGQRLLYTVGMVVAALVASWLLRRTQKNLGLTTLQRWGIAVGALGGALFGAKLPFVAEQSHLGYGAWFADGKTILWGLAGGYFGVELAKWSLEIRVRTGDTFVIPVAVAIAIGRLGCLTFGCCFGTPTEWPWGCYFVTAPDAGAIARHPTQLYELVFHLTIASMAILFVRHQIWRGNLMPAYILAYAIYRFASEFIRPEPRVWNGLTFYQLSAVPIGLAMASILVARIVRSSTNSALNA